MVLSFGSIEVISSLTLSFSTSISQNLIKQEAPGSPYSCAEGYKLYKIGTQGVHVRQGI